MCVSVYHNYTIALRDFVTRSRRLVYNNAHITHVAFVQLTALINTIATVIVLTV